MARQIKTARSRERVRVLTGGLVALSLLLVIAAEGSHTHEEAAESPSACFVCELTHEANPVGSSATPGFAAPTLLRAPALLRGQLHPRPVHRSHRRSRAPPLPISL